MLFLCLCVWFACSNFARSPETLPAVITLGFVQKFRFEIQCSIRSLIAKLVANQNQMFSAILVFLTEPG